MRKFLISLCCISFLFCLFGCNGDGGGSGGTASPAQEPDSLAPNPSVAQPPVETNPDASLEGSIFYSIPFVDGVAFTDWTTITKVQSDLAKTVVEPKATSAGGVAGKGNRVVYSLTDQLTGKITVKVIDSETLAPVAMGAEHDPGFMGSYSPLNDRVLYNVVINNASLHCLGFDGQEIFSFLPGGPANGGGVLNSILSKDGTKVYFGWDDFGAQPKMQIYSFPVNNIPANLAGCDNLYSKDCLGGFWGDFTLAQFGDHEMLFIWENKLWSLDIPTGVATEIATGWGWIKDFRLSPDESKIIIWGGNNNGDSVGVCDTSNWTWLAESTLESSQGVFFDAVCDAAWSPTGEDDFAVMLKRVDVSGVNLQPSYKVYIYSFAGGVFLRSLVAEDPFVAGMVSVEAATKIVWTTTKQK